MCRYLFLCGSFFFNLFLFVPAMAGELEVSLEIPRLDVAEYHRPYVAIWIDGADSSPINLAVLYQTHEDGEESDHGEDWLKDLRQWWRRDGRNRAMPIDGVSGATRGPGKHLFIFPEGQLPLGSLKQGKYTLMVEAVREVGGRELIKIPFTWPVEKVAEHNQNGRKELGKVRLSLKP